MSIFVNNSHIFKLRMLKNIYKSHGCIKEMQYSWLNWQCFSVWPEKWCLW